MPDRKRLKILNIWVDPVTREQAREQVRKLLMHGREAHGIFASNPEKNYSVPRDPGLYRVYREADLLLPDGIGMVLAARLLHGIGLDRVPGSEFIFDICEIAANDLKPVFVFGAKEEVNAEACHQLTTRFPSLVIAGRANGYVPEAGMDELVERINASRAEVLIIALGSPKQEKWFAQYGPRLTNVKVVQGVGGTLDTIAGTVKRAPEFWCRHNLEWLYRLLKEPKRIRRQKVLPLFALAVLREWTTRRKPIFN
jgi:N-acetylglucosaminyldiphosphoundecaprenol N-acetyl-beta-D-mannosaminyltransferase